MKKLLLKSSLAIFALSICGQMEAQEMIPFEMYGFMTKSDVSYNTPQSQEYVYSKMQYVVDSSSPYYLEKQTPAFNTKEEFENNWVNVCSCYVREGVMYAVRHSTDLQFNRISTYDEKGYETFVMNVPITNGYITHTAYVEDEDMLYMVLSTPTSSTANLYKAPGANPADMTLVANITGSFMEKPFSFTYVHEKDLFFYVTNSAKLYSISRDGVKDYYYGIHPDGAALPSDGSDGSNSKLIDECSGLVWSAPYNMLIWVCPRGEVPGSSYTYWYGLELIKGSETPVAHRLMNSIESGLSKNYYNCMVNQGIQLTKGLPPAPSYVSVYSVNGKPGYFDVSWAAVKDDVDGNPIEGEIYYNVYVGDRQIAKKKQPAKGITVGVRFLLPQSYTAETFYVGVETVTEAGTSPMKVEGPNNSQWDPNDPGSWYEGTDGIYNAVDSELDVRVLGNYVTISGLEGEKANVYSIDGKLISTLTQDSTVELNSGLYIVQANNKTLKFVVR